MDWLRRYFYVQEIEWQCETALAAFDVLPDTDPTALSAVDADIVYRAIQSGVAAAANISKLLWSEKNSARADDLKVLLAVSDDSPISSRALRNHFEHFDERLDKWVDEHATTASFVNRNVQPMSEGLKDLVDSGWVLHHFDPVIRVAYFRGEPFPLRPLAAELQRILDTCRSFYSDVGQIASDD